uniref:Uncharacterized protein n=1 Tax=Alexandrium andersonii TaxID=327968 RepID=A0A7S2CHT7_9DINO
MALLRIAALAALCSMGAAHTAHVQSALRHQGEVESDREAGLVRPLAFDHRLRVCNAFPQSTAMDIYRGHERLTESTPMPYKDCRDFRVQLRAGDKLECKLGDNSAGTFSVSELPSNDAVLLLVVHRHDTLSTAVAFASHVFANLKNAQVAIIDTYKGSRHSTPKIMDRPGASKSTHGRSEELRYDSVVAVSPGVYEVELGANVSRSELVALHHESYVVLRMGVEAKQGNSYPEELVVFPHSTEASLQSSAARCVPLAALLVVASALGF